MTLLPYRVAFAAMLYGRGWVSSARVDMIHEQTFGYSVGRRTIWEVLRTLERRGIIKCRVNVRISRRGEDRNLWSLTIRGQTILREDMGRLNSLVKLSEKPDVNIA